MKSAISFIFTYAQSIGYFGGENPASLIKVSDLVKETSKQ